MVNKQVSIQLAESTKENSYTITRDSLTRKLSLVSFDKCEAHLKEKGLIAPTETLSFSKVDWNPDINTDDYSNADMKKSSSVSFNLYAQNGTKIDMKLCANIKAGFNIYLKNKNQLNLTKYEEFADKGYDLYDTESPYFNDRCIRIRKTDKAVVLDDRRNNFDNVTAGCNKGCKMEKIDPKTGYMSCNCENYEPAQEVYPDFGKVFIQTLNTTNIEIALCLLEVFIYVINIFNF